MCPYYTVQCTLLNVNVIAGLNYTHIYSEVVACSPVDDVDQWLCINDAIIGQSSCGLHLQLINCIASTHNANAIA